MPGNEGRYAVLGTRSRRFFSGGLGVATLFAFGVLLATSGPSRVICRVGELRDFAVCRVKRAGSRNLEPRPVRTGMLRSPGRLCRQTPLR